MITMNLTGKNIVITGAAGVLCSQFAVAVSELGANVAILDLDDKKGTELANSINDKIGKKVAYFYKCNVLDKSSIEEVKEKFNKEVGLCDILINGAGGNKAGGTTTKEYYEKGDENNQDIMTFFNLDKESVEFVFNLNFLGTLLPTQVFAKDMLGKEGCSIINISSMNAYTPLTKIPAYSGAKAAISNFTQWLAVHFSKEKIRVNALAPGFFATEQNRHLLFDEKGNLSPRSEKILSQTPMGRFGEPHDLIGTLLFLIDNSSSGFITGTVIPIDGGFSAYSGV